MMIMVMVVVVETADSGCQNAHSAPHRHTVEPYASAQRAAIDLCRPRAGSSRSQRSRWSHWRLRRSAQTASRTIAASVRRPRVGRVSSPAAQGRLRPLDQTAMRSVWCATSRCTRGFCVPQHPAPPTFHPIYYDRLSPRHQRSRRWDRDGSYRNHAPRPCLHGIGVKWATSPLSTKRA